MKQFILITGLTCFLAVPKSSHAQFALVDQTSSNADIEFESPLLESVAICDKGSTCFLDADCDDGQDQPYQAWINDLSSVSRIQFNTAGCTGTLLNTSDESFRPLILTARHCVDVNDLTHNVGDYLPDHKFFFNRVSDNYADGCTTVYDWAARDCGNSDYDCIQGATVVASGGRVVPPLPPYIDFMLLELNEAIPEDFNAHYAGWSIDGSSITQGTLLGHPSGYFMTIAFDDDNVTTSIGNLGLTIHDGQVCYGSSGSTVRDQDHSVRGIVTGPATDCAIQGHNTGGPDLSAAWEHGDPANNGEDTLLYLLAADDPSILSVLPLSTFDHSIDSKVFTPVADDNYGGGFFRTTKAILVSNSAIETGGNLELRAREGISLTGTFLGELGSTFLAEIEETPNGSRMGNQMASQSPSSNSLGVASGEVPEIRFSLSSGFPNPFADATSFRLTLPSRSRVVFAVYDLLGREIASPVDDFKESGNSTLTWNGRDSSGRQLPSGIYLYRLEAGDHVVSGRMTIVR